MGETNSVPTQPLNMGGIPIELSSNNNSLESNDLKDNTAKEQKETVPTKQDIISILEKYPKEDLEFLLDVIYRMKKIKSVNLKEKILKLIVRCEYKKYVKQMKKETKSMSSTKNETCICGKEM